MRSLNKNKQRIWYALYKGRIPIYRTDSAGEPIIDPQTNEKIETGEYINAYENPVEIKISVSAGKSDAEAEVFGMSVEYDRILCTTDIDIPITETTLIWKETDPKFNDDGTVDGKSADYQVSAMPIKSLNSMLIPIKRLEKRKNAKND